MRHYWGVSCKPAVCGISKGQSAPENADGYSAAQISCIVHSALVCMLQKCRLHFFHVYTFLGTGNLRHPSLSGREVTTRLTQLPFIASDKRLNHTLHCPRCLLVIRSRILLSLSLSFLPPSQTAADQSLMTASVPRASPAD